MWRYRGRTGHKAEEAGTRRARPWEAVSGEVFAGIWA
ncbi:unnamed protein product [Gulo gulo]|uniref:Uncharacterized protein n=1 Tax=Gulo gulo TaxID=48420 RepID=A0A9X9M857_GULGU|nr:unnamed protein product [Gulo gulo]